MAETSSASMVQALWSWIRQCPQLRRGAKVGVDYLADTASEYAIYAIPSVIRTRENVLGEIVPADVQTQNFYFASKEPYGADAQQTMLNQAFYEGIVEWIWDQTRARNLPKIPAGRVIAVVPTLTALIADAGSDVAKYQIQIQLTYRRE